MEDAVGGQLRGAAVGVEAGQVGVRQAGGVQAAAVLRLFGVNHDGRQRMKGQVESSRRRPRRAWRAVLRRSLPAEARWGRG
eukprot:364612-Chlamydomonas_euryale.AAC.9